MPLILAVEPDRRQAANLAAVLRVRPRTELVMANAAAPALEALGNRVPDILLTSQLLSPQDDAAIAAWMEALGPDAAGVQALTIPILSASQSEPEPVRGIFARLRRRPAPVTPRGCEPSAFASHVAVYLDRVAPKVDVEVLQPLSLMTVRPGFAARLRALGTPYTPFLAVPALTVPASRVGAALYEWRLARLAAALAVDDAGAPQEEPWVDLPLEPLAEPVSAVPMPDVVHEPATDVWVLRVVPGMEDVLAPVQTVREVQEVRKARKPRKTTPAPARASKPVQDEWGFFDPAQCGFAALLDKLDEITDSQEADDRYEGTTVRLIAS